MNNQLVSVVVATYRRDETLGRALNSIAKQTYTNIEIILVDDNDKHEWNSKVDEITKRFKADNQIVIRKITNKPNQGSAKSRNIGIENSEGEYVTFLDDDDEYLPEKIERQIELMVSERSDYCLTDLVLYNDNGTLSAVRKHSYLNSTENANLLLCHLKYHMTGTDTMMFRRDYLLGIGGFDEIDVGDEFYLMSKAIGGGGKLSYLDRSDVRAYVHKDNGGLSSGLSKINGENSLYKYKRTFFSQLKYNEKRYITMRHYAVLCFAYYRMGSYIKALVYGFLSAITAPKQCYILLKNRKRMETT